MKKTVKKKSKSKTTTKKKSVVKGAATKKTASSIAWSDPYSAHTETGVAIRFNNSGGHWWLSDTDEAGLVHAGFRLNIQEHCGRHVAAAFLPNVNMHEALDVFAKATQYTGRELGCFSCCGSPFSFTAYVNGKESESYYPSAPTYGDAYY